MLRIKFFVVSLIFLVSCLGVKAMESKNKTTEKPNEINLKVEDKTIIENIIKYVEDIEKRGAKNISFDEIDIVIYKLSYCIDNLKNFLVYGEDKNNFCILVNRIASLMLNLFKESLFRIIEKTKNIKYSKTDDDIRLYITRSEICQERLVKLKQKINNKEIINKINKLLKEFCDMNLILIKIHINIIEKINIKNNLLGWNSHTIYSIYEHKEYLEKINEIEDKENIFDEQIKNQISKLNETVLDIQFRVLKKYFEEINKKIETLEKIDIKDKSFEDMRDIMFSLKGYRLTLEKIFKKTKENSNKNKVGFLINRILNLMFKIFEESIVRLETENIKNKTIDEIEDNIIYVKLRQRDLRELKQKISSIEIKEKINGLINKFFNVNLDLIKIYCFKAKADAKINNCLTFLSLLYNLEDYIKEIIETKDKEEIFDEQISGKIDETKKEILNAKYEILKKYYVKNIVEYISKNIIIMDSWIDYNLEMLDKLKNDCISLLKDDEVKNVNYLIETLTKMKNIIKKKNF